MPPVEAGRGSAAKHPPRRRTTVAAGAGLHSFLVVRMPYGALGSADAGMNGRVPGPAR